VADSFVGRFFFRDKIEGNVARRFCLGREIADGLKSAVDINEGVLVNLRQLLAGFGGGREVVNVQ
jgi:hypothetical protein